jgi:pyridoxal phosphate enzyme (YggS family)
MRRCLRIHDSRLTFHDSRLTIQMVNKERYHSIKKELDAAGCTLVAVSKLKSVEHILELYNLGQRDFGENYVQELAEKAAALPKDIRWHFIGHLQTNKVKFIAPFIHLIHGVDSRKLLDEIDKQGGKNNRKINVLLQVHIAIEETKFGLDGKELKDIITAVQDNPLPNTIISGLMGMASFTENTQIVENEFQSLEDLYNEYRNISTPSISFEILSMGMSADYNYALKHGSNMVRIGSLLFGHRS